MENKMKEWQALCMQNRPVMIVIIKQRNPLGLGKNRLMACRSLQWYQRKIPIGVSRKALFKYSEIPKDRGILLPSVELRRPSHSFIQEIFIGSHSLCSKSLDTIVFILEW
jgi:hypothetical protein